MRGQLLAYALFGTLVGAWLFLPAGMILSSTQVWSRTLWDAFGPQVAPLLSGSTFSVPGMSVFVSALIVAVPRAALVAWRVLRFKRRLAARKVGALAG